jgi:hypothetical protein
MGRLPYKSAIAFKLVIGTLEGLAGGSSADKNCQSALTPDKSQLRTISFIRQERRKRLKTRI